MAEIPSLEAEVQTDEPDAFKRILNMFTMSRRKVMKLVGGLSTRLISGGKVFSVLSKDSIPDNPLIINDSVSVLILKDALAKYANVPVPLPEGILEMQLMVIENNSSYLFAELTNIGDFLGPQEPIPFPSIPSSVQKIFLTSYVGYLLDRKGLGRTIHAKLRDRPSMILESHAHKMIEGEALALLFNTNWEGIPTFASHARKGLKVIINETFPDINAITRNDLEAFVDRCASPESEEFRRIYEFCEKELADIVAGDFLEGDEMNEDEEDFNEADSIHPKRFSSIVMNKNTLDLPFLPWKYRHPLNK